MFAVGDYIPLPFLRDVQPEDIEDVEKFRQIPPQKLEEILKETPKHLMDIIGDILLAFLLKENVPATEAENLVGKVREKKANRVLNKMADSIRVFIESCIELGIEDEIIMNKLTENFQLEPDQARERIETCLKKNNCNR